MIVINKLKQEDQDKLTPQQKASIQAEGKIIVSASAGSGKTSTMVLKIIALILNGKHLKDMLIVVYNDAAAAELKQKLHSKLSEMIDDDNTDEESSLRCREEIRDMDFCQISTIHAFCRTLVKENFQDLNISPQFDILDDQKEAKLKDRALDNVFSSYDENDEIFSDILEIFAKQRRDDNLKENIINLYRTYYIQPNKDEFEQQIDKCFSCKFEDSYYVNYLYDYYISMFNEYLNYLTLAKSKIIDGIQENFINKCDYSIELCEYLLRSKDLIGLAKAALNYPKYEGKNLTKKTSDPNLEKIEIYLSLIKCVCEALTENVKSLSGYCEKEKTYREAHIQNGIYIKKLIEILKEFEKEFKRLKADENKYTFDDLLDFAVQLIKNKEGGLDKYEYVFVDEYQDVTPLTEFITSYFIDKNSFLVGDVKQSIYGFNLADPTIFLKRNEEYVNNGDLSIGFNRNFRSRKNLLSFVNDVFSSIMTRKSADIDYLNDAAFELQDAKQGGEVEINIITNSPIKGECPFDKMYDITGDNVQEEDDVSKSYFEGKYIAKKIKSLIENENYIHDDNNNPKRINYSDIVILFRGRSSETAKIIDAIKEENIPIDDSSFVSSDNNPERDLMSLLRTIDNPMQDTYLVGFLLSFFGGYNEEELAQIATNFHGNTFYEKLVVASRSNCSLSNKIKATLAMLDEYRIKASFKSVSDLMSGIISDFSYDAYLMHSGICDVNSLKSFIIKKANRKGDSLSEFINDYSTKERSTSLISSSNSVKVSTFHAYKGLESPVVFIANVTKSFNLADIRKDILFTGNGNIAIKYFDLVQKYKYNSVSFDALLKIIKQKNQKEEMRLLYVALTRAKERMYITGTKSEPEKMPDLFNASSNYDFLRQAEYLSNGKVKINYLEVETEEKVKDGIAIHEYNQRIIDAIIESQKFSYSNKLATKLGMKYGVSSLISDDEGIPFVFESKADIGTLYHKVMQKINYADNTIEAIDEEFKKFIEEKELTIEELENVDKKLILNCLSTNFMKKALEADKENKVHREEKFMMYIEANKISDKDEFQTDEKVLVQGIIDLYFDGDESTLVDFKYSDLLDSAIIEKYKRQLRLYKTAIEAKYNKKVDKVILYSFKNGKEILVED